MRFAVIVPTIRPDTAAFHGALAESLTYPTMTISLRDTMEDRRGHSQSLNEGLDVLAAVRDSYGFAVKLDDDILLRRGWQDVVIQSFHDVSDLGVMGLDVSHSHWEPMARGMVGNVMVDAELWAGRTRFRNLRRGNVWGMMLASPVDVMLDVGAIPVMDGETYPFFADTWYCEQVRKRGLKVGYVIAGEDVRPDVIEYVDDPAYVAGKEADTDRIKNAAMRELKRR